MATLSELITLVDQGVDTGFAASLAGLSLAAAAFFTPAANEILSEKQAEIDSLHKLVEKGESKGFIGETPNKEKLKTLEDIVSNTKRAHTSLIKAFLIFVWFVVYTISFDQMLTAETSKALMSLITSIPSPSALPFQIIDLLISLSLLSWAGKNLWVGANGIGHYFDINFSEEKERINEIREYLRKVGNGKSS